MVAVTRLPNPTASQLLDLCLLGMAWQREDFGILDRLGNTIMTVMRNEGVFSRDVLRHLGTNTRLISLAIANSEEATGITKHAGGVSPKRTVLEFIEQSDKWFGYVKAPGSLMSWPYLFLPKGYPLIITNAGCKYILNRAAEFTEKQIITKDAFLAAAGRYRRGQRGMYAEGR